MPPAPFAATRNCSCIDSEQIAGMKKQAVFRRPKDKGPGSLAPLNNHVNAIRFSTLAALCSVLSCKPGDLLEYETD